MQQSDVLWRDRILQTGALPLVPCRFDSVMAIADRLSVLKRHARRTPGNYLLIERRRH